ncbi:site-specific integrase [Arthrobacter agilis]|uniref:site-specific integrase n=1 Tax=Arthrobacter agilis TaxID=37921 RepID=UPI002783BF31|nr:site-specific integrase [Arthrobacter agilis]MDQ0735300.1 integrase [Arthrobacter agilis]
MRGRPRLPVGEYGKITVVGEKPKYVARCWFRDLDGVGRYVTAQGPAKASAVQALKDKVSQRRLIGGAEILPETRVSVLAEAWFTTLDQSQGTKDTYRHILDRHILKQLGNLQIREATTARLDTFLRDAAKKGPSVGKSCRVVLSMMFGLASRYDAVPANPVTDTKLARVERKKVTALSVAEVGELRRDVAAWAAQRASRAVMLDVVDLFVATGLRPGELLGIRFADVDLRNGTLSVTGTVKRDSVSGLHRQPYPKTESGVRTLALPDFAVSMLRRRKLAGTSDLVFPARDGGPWEPSNFRRMWREVRGEKWEHVEPRAFRKAVATLIERESGSLVASQQLGHSSDAVTRKHYIEANHVAPDSRGALEQFRAAE